MRHVLAATVALAAVVAAAVPTPAEASMSSAWRTRNTGLDSDGKCTRRAFNAMKAANLDAKASGNQGVYGANRDTIAYAICQNNGGFVTIFCASDRPNSGNYTTQVCDTVSRFMEK